MPKQRYCMASRKKAYFVYCAVFGAIYIIYVVLYNTMILFSGKGV
jgi:hypothetical protein